MIEEVVDSAVDASEFLERLHPAKPLHHAFSSPEGLTRLYLPSAKPDHEEEPLQDPDREALRKLTIEELDRLIRQREGQLLPLQEELQAMKRIRGAKVGRAARTAKEAVKIKSEEVRLAAMREQLGGGRGHIAEIVNQSGLTERTVHRRLDPWRTRNPRRKRGG